jgi:hypothetical protein
VGTEVFDKETGDLIGEVLEHNQKLLVAKGGWRGFGNASFLASTHQAPTEYTKGKPGEFKELKLELKLLADVGLAGFPNAGKSTLLSVISSARPKIADYPFTTITPNLGVVDMGQWGDPRDSFVVADVPGLIEGASEGVGLGHEFLRHVERAGLLVHLVEPAPSARTLRDGCQDWNTARNRHVVTGTSARGRCKPLKGRGSLGREPRECGHQTSARFEIARRSSALDVGTQLHQSRGAHARGHRAQRVGGRDERWQVAAITCGANPLGCLRCVVLEQPSEAGDEFGASVVEVDNAIDFGGVQQWQFG